MSGAAAFFVGNAVSVAVNPKIASGSGTTAAGAVPAVTAAGAGGAGGYTYAWVVIDSDFALTINSPAAATTGFSFAGVPAGEVATGSVRVTVTDSAGQTASAEVPVSYLRYVS